MTKEIAIQKREKLNITFLLMAILGAANILSFGTLFTTLSQNTEDTFPIKNISFYILEVASLTCAFGLFKTVKRYNKKTMDDIEKDIQDINDQDLRNNPNEP